MTYLNPADFRQTASIDRLHELLETAGMGAGWNKPEPSLWPAPKSNFQPAHWSYALARSALEAAGRFVSTELAERRNLILYNPLPGNSYATLRTMIAAYQMVMPGEVARSHRHTPNALRLVVEAPPKTYTVVNGKKLPMEPGDVLLTPNWSWHGHSNESDACAYWIDVLDVPLVHFLEPMFFEPLAERFIEAAEEIDAASPMRFPWAQTAARLDMEVEIAPGHRRIELGPPALDTMALFVSRLAAGSRFVGGRTTANSIFAAIGGRGTAAIDGRHFAWGRGDIFAVPAWRPHEIAALEDSHLLRVTDEPLLSRLNWLRREP